MFYIYSLVCFRNSEAFKVLLIFHVLLINHDILTAIFSHSRVK
jgi:hypothetical protein